MGAGLVIRKFGYVKEGHVFRYTKRWWIKEGPFIYANFDGPSKARFRTRLTTLVAAKPEHCLLIND